MTTVAELQPDPNKKIRIVSHRESKNGVYYDGIVRSLTSAKLHEGCSTANRANPPPPCVYEGAAVTGRPFVPASASRNKRAGETTIVVIRLPDQPVDLSGDVAAHGVHHVLVPRGHGSRGPAHEPHDGTLRDPEDQEDGCRGVARVVQSAVSDFRVGKQLLPVVVVRPG